MFQSLIGTLQTTYHTKTYLEFMKVSIPHRYATDYDELRNGWWVKMFQSLIGTLQTMFKANNKPSRITFQSLIGTLQTYEELGYIIERTAFQSLIGTLQTMKRSRQSSNFGSFNPS